MNIDPKGRSFSLLEDTVSSVHQALRTHQITCRELVLAYMYRIATFDKAGPSFHAVITMNPSALQQAEAIDRRHLSPGHWPSLYCVPVLVKDAIDTTQMPTTGGTLALLGMVPRRNAYVVQQLQRAGAILIAKTNLDELTLGIWGRSSVGGQARNAYDTSLNPGGSSSGNGVGLAANYAVAALGTDTCGSGRTPAAFNNIVGLRPTLGLISTRGVMPNSKLSDTVAPMARTVSDVAVLLDVVAGVDRGDPATAAAKGKVPRSYTTYLKTDGLKGKRIGVVRQLFGTSADAMQVNAVLDADIQQLRALGATVIDPVTAPGVEDMNLGHFQYWGTYDFASEFTNYLRSLGSAAPIHSFKQLAEVGSAVPVIESSLQKAATVNTSDPAYQEVVNQGIPMAKAAARTPIQEDHLDALLYPTVQVPPAPIGDGQNGSNCVWSALSGFPALTVPGGFTVAGLPVGMELMGLPWSEGTLLEMGYSFEQATHHRQPTPLAPALPDGALGLGTGGLQFP